MPGGAQDESAASVSVAVAMSPSVAERAGLDTYSARTESPRISRASEIVSRRIAQELSVFGVHAGQGRVTPDLREDDAHGQGHVAGAGQHPAESEGVLPPRSARGLRGSSLWLLRGDRLP